MDNTPFRPEKPKRQPLFPEFEYWIVRHKPLRVIKVPVMHWSYQFGRQGHFVKQTFLGGGYIKISTICLGIDHSFGDGPPVIFEDAVLYGGAVDVRERYCTLEEALEGHEKLVAEELKRYGAWLPWERQRMLSGPTTSHQGSTEHSGTSQTTSADGVRA